MSSVVETRVVTLNDRLAELEKDRRNNIASHQSEHLIQPSEDLSKQATDNLLSFVKQTSEQSKREIDRLIDELANLKRKLDNDRGQVQQQIANYAALNQCAAQLTEIALTVFAKLRKSRTQSRNLKGNWV
jgi:ABC-type transporter Mla subunit MlaD